MMFGMRRLLTYPAVVSMQIPAFGPKGGWGGKPSCEEQIFLPPALPGEILLACRGQWAVPNGARMLCRGMRVSRFESQIACAKIVRTAVSQFLMSLYFLFPHKCIGNIVYTLHI